MDLRFCIGDEDVPGEPRFVDRGQAVSGAAPHLQHYSGCLVTGGSRARTNIRDRAGECPTKHLLPGDRPPSSVVNAVGAPPIVRQSLAFLLGIVSGITGGIIVNQIEVSGITRDLSSLVIFYRAIGDVGNFSVNNINFMGYIFTMLQGIYWLTIRHSVHPLYGPLSLATITTIGATYSFYRVFCDSASLPENVFFTIISIATVIFIIFAAFVARIFFGLLPSRSYAPTNPFREIIYAVVTNILGIIFVYATVILVMFVLGIVFVIIAFAVTPGDGLGIFLMGFAWTLSWYPLSGPRPK